jgi:hypothetical protein
MSELRLTFNFNVAMKLGLFILFLGISVKVAAQDKTVDGIVFDKDTKTRIAVVYITNTTTHQSVYNSLKGVFTINAHIGDVLVFTKQDYRPDTIKVQNYTSLAVYLYQGSIELREVTIRDTLATPEQRLEATKNDYTKIYGTLNNRDWLSNSPGGGAGIGIDAIYDALSRSGRNASHLRSIIQANYYQDVIDYRFNAGLVTRITGLKGTELKDFMQKYRPGYYFVIVASDYDFITSIRANYRRYLRRPKAYALDPLVTPTGK